MKNINAFFFNFRETFIDSWVPKRGGYGEGEKEGAQELERAIMSLRGYTILS